MMPTAAAALDGGRCRRADAGATGSGSSLLDLDWLATDLMPDAERGRLADARTSAVIRLAFLQYTSGSTGTPKGVMLTHAQPHAQLLADYDGLRGGSRSGRGVSGCRPTTTWDWSAACSSRSSAVGRVCLMSPMLFLQKPIRWLRAISKYGVTISGGPNFAYDLCTNKITDDELAQTSILSRWSLAFNGAEPVRRETLERFVERFAPCGFRRQTFYPCYGMAETTLIVTGGSRRRSRRSSGASTAQLWTKVVSCRRAPDGDRGRFSIGCGRSLPDEEVVIVDPDTRPRLPDDRVGEIWVRSGSVGQGYWNKPEATEATFRGTAGQAPIRKTYLADRRSGLLPSRRIVRHRPPQGPDHRPRRQSLSAGHRNDGRTRRSAGSAAVRPRLRGRHGRAASGW